MGTKKCPKCQKEFEVLKGKHIAYCPSCTKKYRREWYQKHKKEVAKYNAEYSAIRKALDCARKHNNCFSCTYSDCVYP